MRFTEKNALGRVLALSEEAYKAVCDGDAENPVAVLDTLSAALSHAGSADKPLGEIMGALKRELKAKNRRLYPRLKPYFSRLYPVMDYDYDKALRHIEGVVYGNDRICAEMVGGSLDKARAMCDAMKSYPGFLFGEFSALSDEQFYDLVFGFYPKLYGEDFLGEKKGLFS